jgi:hypothetical protein
MVIGALIVKHRMSLSDEETIEMIRENPYIQYFVGLTKFSNVPVFDSGLFVSIRKRLGVENINEITRMLMQIHAEKASAEKGESESGDKEGGDLTSGIPGATASDSIIDEDGEKHCGTMIIEARAVMRR